MNNFGGKEGLYAVVVDREMSALLDGVTRVFDQQQAPAPGGAVTLAPGLHREPHRRLPRAHPRLATVAGAHHLLDVVQRRRESGGSIRPATSPAVDWTPSLHLCTRMGVGGVGVDDRPVVARRAGAQEEVVAHTW